MLPQDELAQRIRAYVATQVPANQVDTVTRTVCMTVATLMDDPRFLNELLVIRRLREEIDWLKHQVLMLQRATGTPVPRKRAPAKRAPAKKRAAPVKGTATKSQRSSFTRGARGR